MTHFKKSLKEACEVISSLEPLEPLVLRAAETIEAAFLAGNKLLVCGNGGSAADSAHFATEFTCRFCGDRRPYPAIALGEDGGLLTAIGNDYDFQDIFSRQVRAFGKPGDVLAAFTTSGKSRNVLGAIEEARRCGMRTIAFLGKGGGFTKGASELELMVPETKTTARIQEAHKFLLHLICEILEERLPRE